MPARRPDAPGQFAFADQRRVLPVLEESGWVDIDIRPLDITCTFAERELVRYFTRLGPLGRVLANVDDQMLGRIIEAVRPAFDPHVRGNVVRFVAACWVVSAQASK